MNIVAHRGYASKYSENTLEALNEAVKAGANMVEFDVQFTKDLTPIMLHDDNFKRTTGLDRSVFDITRSGLKEQPKLHNICELEDVAAWIQANPGVKAFVELKQKSIDHHGLETCVQRLHESCRPVLDQCVFISFNADAVKIAQDIGFKETGWVILRYDGACAEISKKLSPDYLFADIQILPQDDSKLWQGNWEWVVYEVVSRKVALGLIKRGVGFIETKEVEKMLL